MHLDTAALSSSILMFFTDLTASSQIVLSCERFTSSRLRRQNSSSSATVIENPELSSLSSSFFRHDALKPDDPRVGAQTWRRPSINTDPSPQPVEATWTTSWKFSSVITAAVICGHFCTISNINDWHCNFLENTFYCREIITLVSVEYGLKIINEEKRINQRINQLCRANRKYLSTTTSFLLATFIFVDISLLPAVEALLKYLKEDQTVGCTGTQFGGQFQTNLLPILIDRSGA